MGILGLLAVGPIAVLVGARRVDDSGIVSGATQDEIGARALALVQRLAPALTASFEARHA